MQDHIKSPAHILNLSTLTKSKVLRESLHVLIFVQTYCWSRFHIHCIYKKSAMQSVQEGCILLNVNWPYNKSKDIPTWVECKKDQLLWYSVCYYIKRTTNVAFFHPAFFLEMILKTFKFYSLNLKLIFIIFFMEIWQQPFFEYNCTSLYKYMYPSKNRYKLFYTHIFKNPNPNYTPSWNVKLLKGKPAFSHIMFSSKCYIVCWADTKCQTNDSLIRITQKHL